MDIWTILWIVILVGVGLTVGQVILGLIFYAIIGLFVLVTMPFTWLYNKIKGE